MTAHSRAIHTVSRVGMCYGPQHGLQCQNKPLMSINSTLCWGLCHRLNTILALRSSIGRGHQHGLWCNICQGHQHGLWQQPDPRKSTWPQVTTQTTRNNMTLGSSLAHRHQHVQMEWGHGPQHGPRWQHRPLTPRWVQVTAQATDIHMTLSGNVYEHQHGPWKQKNREPQHGSTGYSHQHSPQCQHEPLTLIWPPPVAHTEEVHLASSGSKGLGHWHGHQWLTRP